MPDNHPKLKRRRALGALGTLVGASLSGCLGDDDDGDAGDDGGDGGDDGGDGAGDDNGDDGGDTLGERVPEPIDIPYYGNIPITGTMEPCAPVIQENLEEVFESEIDVRPMAVGEQYAQMINDAREYHLSFTYHSASPDRLDPHDMLRRWGVDWAGANGRANLMNYANCEFTQYAIDQAAEGDVDRRRELVNQAYEISSNDLCYIPLFPEPLSGIYNENTVEVDGVGDAGIRRGNPFHLIKSDLLEGDVLVTNSSASDDAYNHLLITGAVNITDFNNIWLSPLVTWNENYEQQAILASDYEGSDGGRVFEFQLEEDATFHNGDPVTAEDVKFTFEHIWNYPGSYTLASPPSGDYTIEAVSEKEVRFEFENPQPTFLTVKVPRWGIIHKASYEEAGAHEGPEDAEFDSTPPGTGPFMITERTLNEFRAGEPHPEGHPVYDPDHTLAIQFFDGMTPAMESFLAGDIDIIRDASMGALERAEAEMDAAVTQTAMSFAPLILYPQMSYAPGKLEEFRAAIAASLDRQLMIELAADGRAEPALYSTNLMESHPWRPPEDRLRQMTDDPTGDIDGARQYLEDAGWGWDDDGNLRYPEGADLDPLWPEGETPRPEDFECLNDEGEYQAAD